ncbi:carboxymuconolactone decarboxylase family protein [Arthrobacter sp. AFG20]|uniref:carboxymuconolactone decarboxylase family protein n=1 Tax=Arthrobacter sp. AFG20 TaxID=1688671 RepID=UPI0027E575F3|nr:carboxymuconolactone decarboxylase family protein [Arthrobacter sp. AFG20]
MPPSPQSTDSPTNSGPGQKSAAAPQTSTDPTCRYCRRGKAVPIRWRLCNPELSARDRSLITVAVLTAGGNTDQLGFHIGRAIDNGVTQEELIEAITHVTFYAGWPRGMSAMGVAKQLFTDDK